MFPLLKKLFTDETAFVGYARFVLIGVGIAAATGSLPLPTRFEWIGAVIAGAGGFIRAGEKNDPL
jgi:hypothetical protein